MIIKALCVIGEKARSGNSPLWPGCRYDVDDDVAKRLIAQGVAKFEEISARPAPADTIPGENPTECGNAPEGAKLAVPVDTETNTMDRTYLESLSLTELKDIARRFGVYSSTMRTKGSVIEALLSVPVSDEDELPELLPQDVVDE